MPVSEIDLVHLSKCYGLAFIGCALVVSGGNRTYRLATEGKAYYLRLYSLTRRSPAEIAFELRLLREVRPTPGIDVARPIRTAEGADCASIVFEGVTRAACLFQALDGRAVGYELGDMALFGAALAKLHDALAGIKGGEARLLDP